MQKYIDQKDDLYAGRTPLPKSDGLQLRDLLNHFLTAKQRKVDSEEMKLKTFSDYRACGARLVGGFGRPQRLVDDLRAEDFGKLRAQLAKTRGPIALGNEIQRVRSIFKYGYETGLLEKPMRFGPEFVKPSQKTMRHARQARGERMLEPAEIQALLNVSSVQIRAMTLLGVNCGFGNTDVSELPAVALDLKKGIVDFPRPKTAIQRRSSLWPETIDALRIAIAARPNPKDEADAGLVFITKYGMRWVKTKTNGVTIDAVCKEFGKLLQQLTLKRPGMCFYTLRHTFRTIADEIRDHPAVVRIMGHADSSSMATRYRERITDERLKAVTDYVRGWLFEK